MMRLLYSIGIWLYGAAVTLASIWNVRAKKLLHGWRSVWDVLPKRIDNDSVAWFHASSLGEFEQARPVIEQYKKRYPNVFIVLTFFSPSGYDVRKNYDMADVVSYLPLDTPHHARRFVEALHPQVAFFVKYDFWFNFLHYLNKNQVPTYLFSAIFRKNQYFFHSYGHWFCKQLRKYDHIFVQNEESVSLLQQHGVSSVSMAGDTRFDRVYQIAHAAETDDVVERFKANDEIVVAGSTWPEDEMLLQSFMQRHQDVRMVIAPHMIGEDHLQDIERLFSLEQTVRYTQVGKQQTTMTGCRVLIVDCIGRLSSMYRYAKVAYVGGGFGKGIHNILEVSANGSPVCFGPNYHKFQEAVDLKNQGGAWSVENDVELDNVLTDLLDNDEKWCRASSVCLEYMKSHLGATDVILSHVCGW